MNKSTVVDLAQVPVHTGSAQHIGKRENQQDAWGFSNLSDATFARHGGCLGVLADGMGGMEQGVWASAQAVKEMIAQYQQKPPSEPISAALKRSLIEANRTVYQQAKSWRLIGKMGTTLVAAVIHDRSLHWISTGDSRVYLISEQAGIKQLTTDHNYQRVLELKIERGEITSEEAKAHPFRNGLTSFVGDEEIETIDQSMQGIPIDPGSWVLLCSDGLSGVLSDVEILEAFSGRSPQGICRHLIDEVKKRNLTNQDNVSIVVMRVPVAGEVQQVSAIRGPVVSPSSHSESDRDTPAPTKMADPNQLSNKAKKMFPPSKRILISVAALCLLGAVLMSLGAFLQSNGAGNSAVVEPSSATQPSAAVTIPIQPAVEEPRLSPNLSSMSVPSREEQKAEAERVKKATEEAQAEAKKKREKLKTEESNTRAKTTSTPKLRDSKSKPNESSASAPNKPGVPSQDGSKKIDLTN